MCRKRAFRSESEVREAHRGASFRFRVYRCDECPGTAYHVANKDKSSFQWEEYEEGLKRKIRGTNPRLAPARTLAEVEAIAARMRQRGDPHGS